MRFKTGKRLRGKGKPGVPTPEIGGGAKSWRVPRTQNAQALGRVLPAKTRQAGLAKDWALEMGALETIP